MGVLFKLLTLLLVSGCWAAPENIVQENGGFKGILVAINENVPYDPRILPNLKEVMLQTSKAMYRATEYDIKISGDPDNGGTSAKHLAQITVLVPKSWPTVPDCNASISETYGKADFRVRQPSRQYGEYLMYTKMQNADCREPGQYTEIPVTFLEDLDASRTFYGEDLGKAVLHEWAHLRWGVRAESNYKDGGDTCYVKSDWYNAARGIPIRCSSAVKGQTKADPPGSKDTCTFTPQNDQSNKATASLMFFHLPFYTKMYTFCDSRYELTPGDYNQVEDEMLHEGEIDHPHNHVCDRQSVWQVLREHPDFDPANAAPEVPSFDFDGNFDFQCVQESNVRIVLVMDVSGSMNGAPIEQLGNDVASFIQNIPLNQTNIGMVEFESAATELLPIIPLNSTINQERLLNAIPTVAGGGTCIGCGITKAIELLEEGGESPAGGHIFVFTDGKGSIPSSVAAEVALKQVIVYGLLMAGVADDHDLIEIATDSGGSYCVYDPSSNNGTDYYQCMMAILDGITSSAAAEIRTDDVQVPSQGSFKDSVPIDASFEDSLRFTLSWTNTTTFLTHAQAQELEESGKVRPAVKKAINCPNVEMVITAPDGTTIDKTDPRYDYQAQFGLIRVDASGFPEGTWDYEVVNPSSGVCNARLRIEGIQDTSSPDDAQQPILLTAQANKDYVNVDTGVNPQDNIVTLYFTLRQGLSPVVDAEVTAAVEAGSYSEQITLSDDGQGPDNAADDGIYSAYFYQYSGDGVYSVRAAAKGISGQTQILREERQLYNRTDSEGYEVVRTQTLEPVAAFERAAIGGSFEVKANGVSDMNAIIPPGRINDLKRSAMNNDSVELRWTAVGASMLDGKADHYEVRICANVTDEWDTCMEVDQSMLTEGDLSTPKLSGSSELIAISLDYLEVPVNGSSYYVRVKAVDQYDNKGASSNLAHIQGVMAPVAPPPVTNPPPTNPPPTNPPPTQAPPTGTPAPGTPGPVPPPPKNVNFAAIAGAVACAAVIAMVTVGGAITRVHIKKKKQVHPANPEQPVESVQFEDREIKF